jgi:hypothetical protein
MQRNTELAQRSCCRHVSRRLFRALHGKGSSRASFVCLLSNNARAYAITRAVSIAPHQHPNTHLCASWAVTRVQASPIRVTAGGTLFYRREVSCRRNTERPSYISLHCSGCYHSVSVAHLFSFLLSLFCVQISRIQTALLFISTPCSPSFL